ncbi:MAG: helix-turn-helix domain-containing protein [Deltaproteobacteria bacterium]|nr:helix-turn-helix domain-containing protein [Deltaproteobacteria bacterium]
MSTKPKTDETKESLSRNEGKWTPKLMAAGWVAIPAVIIEQQAKLQLSPTDMNIILFLASKWWEKEKLPFPSKKHIAESIGIDAKTVQRRISQLEKVGYLKRHIRQRADKSFKSNMYSFDGLIEKSTPLAIEAVKERAKKRQERESNLIKQAKRRPSAAHLKMVKDADEEEAD